MPERGYAAASIVTPNRADAELSVALLCEQQIPASAHADLRDLALVFEAGVGCIVIVEEALTRAELPLFADLLAHQPAWRDVPLVIIGHHAGHMNEILTDAFPTSGNVTLLERPLSAATLVSAVRVGLRATRRQLEVKGLLEEREQAVRSRDEFLAMLAHELRNPLAPMRNALAVQKTIADGDPVLARMHGILDRQLTHIVRMVDDLVDVARLERGKVTLRVERVDLNQIVSSAADACQAAIQARGHTLELELSATPIPLDADPTRIEQVVCNLVTNAAKFSPRPDRVRVTTRADATGAMVEVEDSGAGFSPDAAESLFGLFVQGEQSLARSTGGLGIGLTISRHIAQLHRGTLRARSEGPGRGARFTLRLPLAQNDAPERTATGQSTATAQSTAPELQRHVLIVEDSKDIRETMRVLLTLWGHDVRLAATGEEALAAMARARPDVAIIDIGLPGMNGYDLARHIRATSEGPGSTPVRLIAITGYGQPSDAVRARQAGFDAHLLKPVAPDALREMLGA